MSKQIKIITCNTNGIRVKIGELQHFLIEKQIDIALIKSQKLN